MSTNDSISEEELRVCADVLRRIVSIDRAQNKGKEKLVFFQSPQCREIRKAMQPLADFLRFLCASPCFGTQIVLCVHWLRMP